MAAPPNVLPSAISTGFFTDVRTITGWSPNLPPLSYVYDVAHRQIYTDWWAQGDLQRWRANAVSEASDGSVTLTASVDATLPGGWRSGGVYYGEKANERWVRPGDFIQAAVLHPAVKGAWTAFWLTSRETYDPPEIDIVEMVNSTDTSYHYCHWEWGWDASGLNRSDPSSETKSFTKSYSAGQGAGQWHLFGVHIKPTAVDYYIDGALAGSNAAPTGGYATAKWTVLIDLAVGGSFPGSPDGTTPSSFQTLVGPVKIWSPAAPTVVYSSNIRTAIKTVTTTPTRLSP